MAARPRQHRFRLNTSSRQAPAIGLALVLLAWTSLAVAAIPIEDPTPPPAPQVAPVISGTYPTDLDGNRIHDELEQPAAGKGNLSIAEEAVVKVELVFSEPVTQAQIDDFLALGGQITYLYEAVSFGWNGLIPAANLDLIPTAMGPTLVQVEPVRQAQFFLDVATQTGRVRPIWKSGFAGAAAGFNGSDKTTIAFIGSGVDGTHKDLKGRCVYWRDFTSDSESSAVDFYGHETIVAGVAVGSGESSGDKNTGLRYTFNDRWPAIAHLVEPISLPSLYVQVTSQAYWSGGSAYLLHLRWAKGTELDEPIPLGTWEEGVSPLTLRNAFMATNKDVFGAMLADFDSYALLDGVTIVTSVDSYPGVGDGFNKFRGVAPSCKWAAAKVADRDGWGDSDAAAAALDALVAARVDKNIKIINLSQGFRDEMGIAGESLPFRDKVQSAVNNGIVVIVAAGNDANWDLEIERKMGDPARAALAITVGASSDENVLTDYSTYGFFSPRKNNGEDYKPDLIAPGGSVYHTGILSLDSGSSDCQGMDKEPDDYANAMGTSASAPFVSGCAALVIEAMEKNGTTWDFTSSKLPRYVKMLLCATSSETNANRESGDHNPTLERAAGGPQDFPAGKDAQEGYGLVNADAAVEAVCQTYSPGANVTAELGGDATAKRVWARTVKLTAGADLNLALDVPSQADFDLYLYSATPSETGTPVLLASGTSATLGGDESLGYAPTSNTTGLLVVKRVSGTGTFTLRSTQAGPPTAQDVEASVGINASTTITLTATDDGRPNPPGALSYTIASLPKHGRLESVGGAAITAVPSKLTSPADKVVYRPNQDWVGDDSFTFFAHDGGNAPSGGQSNTATVTISVVRETTVEYQVVDGMDDAHGYKWGMQQSTDDSILLVGQYAAGMRFRGVKVPQGALIKSATLKIRSCSSGLTGLLDGVLYAEAADNGEDFSGRKISQLTKTGASVPWIWGDDTPWVANTWYESPNIAGVVQEVVDRAGWKPDNAMVLVYWTNSYMGSDRKIWAYNGNAAHAAKLVITYQPR